MALPSMAPPMMILPKGIVLNTDHIYKEVASYPVVPPEKIWEYWHVYTTTFRTLIDPTANRLENFWWHVMGSNRRFLSGRTLARLFEDISKGPTVVRLRGPPNRYEGPSSPPSPVAQDAAIPKGQLRQTDRGRQSKSKETAKPTLSSSSRPPPPHPILKKPSQPSASGPRPTARFVSPAESDIEDGNRDSDAASSTSTAVNSGLDTKGKSTSTAREERKKPTTTCTTKKKVPSFVASSAAKRRPGMPRRPSSQSSTGGFEVGSNRESNSSVGSKYLASMRPVAPIVERSKFSPAKTQDTGGLPNAKAAEKRPAAGPSDKSSTSVSGDSQAQSEVVREDTADTTRPQKTAVDRMGKGKMPACEVDQTSPATLHPRNDGHERARPVIAHPMGRSRSDVGARSRLQELPGRAQPQALISTSTATTSTITAQGTIIEFDENAPAQAITNALRRQEEEGGSILGSMPRSQFTPTAPSNTATVPLGRSKCQLTLLLERDNEKKPRR